MFVLRAFLSLFLLCVLSGIPLASAHPDHPCCLHSQPVESAGHHRHGGLFLRISGGPGLTHYRASGSDEGQNTPFAIVEFSIGATVAENLSLHFGGVASAATEPQLRGEVGLREEIDRVDIMIIGPGVTYHLPGNFYLSATVGDAMLAFTETATPGEVEQILATEHGFGGSMSFGKEWWVSSNWGIGLALQGMYVISDGRSFLAGGPVFSATFN